MHADKFSTFLLVFLYILLFHAELTCAAAQPIYPDATRSAIYLVASTNPVHVLAKNADMREFFLDFENMIFNSMGASVLKVGNILKKKLTTLELKIDGKPIVPKAPLDRIESFFNNLDQGKYSFLRDITIMNRGIALVWGYFIPQLFREAMTSKQIEPPSVTLIINIYLLDSGIMEFDQIVITGKEARDINALKAKINDSITKLFSDCIKSQGAIIDNPSSANNDRLPGTNPSADF